MHSKSDKPVTTVGSNKDILLHGAYNVLVCLNYRVAGVGKLQDFVLDLSALKKHLKTEILMYLHMERVCAALHTYIHYLWLDKKQVHWSALFVRSGGKTENMDFLLTVVIFSYTHALSLSLSRAFSL